MDAAHDGDVTPQNAADVAHGCLGGWPEADAVVSERQPKVHVGSPLEEPVAVRGGRHGDQVVAGDDLGSEAVSGESGFAAGEIPAPGGGGSGGGSVSVPIEGSRPITPFLTAPEPPPDRPVAPNPPGPSAEPDLTALARELGGDAAIVERFVRDYLDLLDERLPDIRRFLRTGNDEAAYVALLSLESTTAMFGVPDVVAAVAALRAGVGNQSREALLDELAVVVARVFGLRERLVVGLIQRVAAQAASDQLAADQD